MEKLAVHKAVFLILAGLIIDCLCAFFLREHPIIVWFIAFWIGLPISSIGGVSLMMRVLIPILNKPKIKT